MGYRYNGPGNIYSLTWIELLRLVDASQLMDDLRSGIRPGDIDKLQKVHSKVKNRIRRDD